MTASIPNTRKFFQVLYYVSILSVIEFLAIGTRELLDGEDLWLENFIEATGVFILLSLYCQLFYAIFNSLKRTTKSDRIIRLTIIYLFLLVILTAVLALSGVLFIEYIFPTFLLPILYSFFLKISDSESVKASFLKTMICALFLIFVNFALFLVWHWKIGSGKFDPESALETGCYASIFFINNILSRRVVLDDGSKKDIIRLRLILKFAGYLVIALLAFLLVAGWIITLPVANYFVRPTERNAGKIVVVERFEPAFSNGSDEFETLGEYYGRLHWKRPVSAWVYDIETGGFEKKHWDLKTVENGMDFIPVFSDANGEMVVVADRGKKDSRNAKLMFQNEEEGIVFEYNHNNSVWKLIPSPENDKLFFCDAGERGCQLYDISERAITDIFDSNIAWPRWLAGNLLYYIARDDKEGYDGIFSLDLESGTKKRIIERNIVQNEPDDLIHFTVSRDGKELAVCLPGKKDKEDDTCTLTRLSLYSVETGEVLKSFEYDGVSCIGTLVGPMLQPGANNILLYYSKGCCDGWPPECGEVKFVNWDGKLLKEFRVKDLTFYGFSGVWWVTRDIAVANAAFSKNFRLGKETYYQLLDDALMINVRTGKFDRMSEVIKRHKDK
ncbi:MAG: hypothetical protein ABIH66_08675 [bacterium]